MPHPTLRTADADAIFFTALANGHAVRTACLMAEYARRSVYRWRHENPDFSARWAAALQMAVDILKEEADRRGRDGYDVPVFHRGEVVGTKRKYADGLLLARLKAIRPEVYRESKALAAPPQTQPTIVLRDFAMEDVVRRLARGEAIDRTTLPQRIQQLIAAPDSEARH